MCAKVYFFDWLHPILAEVSVNIKGFITTNVHEVQATNFKCFIKMETFNIESCESPKVFEDSVGLH